MKKLTHYTKNGYQFAVHARIDNVAIFHGRSTKSESESWEVIRIQSHDGRDVHGTHYDPAEYPPSNEQFGRFGWSMTSEESAHRKMIAVLKAVHDAAANAEVAK